MMNCRTVEGQTQVSPESSYLTARKAFAGLADQHLRGMIAYLGKLLLEAESAEEQATIIVRLRAATDLLLGRSSLWEAGVRHDPFASLTDPGSPLDATNPPPAALPPIDTDRETEVCYRGLSNLHLAEIIEELSYAAAEPIDDTDAILVGDRLRIALAEQARRDRLSAAGHDVPSPRDPRIGPWNDLKRQIKDTVDILAVFELGGYAVHDVSRTEAHAACLACGGKDRLVIRLDAPGRYWCRQCGLRGDVITAAMNLIPECRDSFTEALVWLARNFGLSIPTDPQNASRRRASPRKSRGPVPVRKGSRRGH